MYRNFTILVAEDSRDDAFLLKRAFLKAGVNAPLELVENGDSAVNYLAGHKPFDDRQKFPFPKLLILDVKMPGCNGFEVLKWVREHRGFHLLPILMLSSSDDQQDIDKAHELGANGYTVKPCGIELLTQMVLCIEGYWLKQHRYPSVPARGAEDPLQVAG